MMNLPLFFFSWRSNFDIDNKDGDDDYSTGRDSVVRYDSNNDGDVTNTDNFVWNFGDETEYPFIASTPGTSDEQAVRMASGALHFSNTTIGIPSASDFAFFYDIEDDASTISITVDLVQGVTVGNYTIESAIDANGNELKNIDMPQIDAISGSIMLPPSFAIGSKFYLSSVFTKGTASFTRSYSFKK